MLRTARRIGPCLRAPRGGFPLTCRRCPGGCAPSREPNDFPPCWHPAGMRILCKTRVRWCRSFLAQPPATIFDPSGISGGRSSLRGFRRKEFPPGAQAEGFPCGISGVRSSLRDLGRKEFSLRMPVGIVACSRWVSAATPPESGAWKVNGRRECTRPCSPPCAGPPGGSVPAFALRAEIRTAWVKLC